MIVSHPVELKPKASEIANLKQALEWIAFGLEPLTPEYDKVFRDPFSTSTDSLINGTEAAKSILNARHNIFIALREGHLPSKGALEVPVHWDQKYYEYSTDFRLDEAFMPDIEDIPSNLWKYSGIYWSQNCLLYEDSVDRKFMWLAATQIQIKAQDLFKIFPKKGLTETEDKPLALKTIEAKNVLTTREKQTALKLILGMAMSAYKYDPKANKNTAVTKIVHDLDLLELTVSDDTIRKWLKEAKALLPSNLL